MVFSEIDTYLKYSLAGRNNRHYFKIHKPFWNDTLTEMWKNMNVAEHTFLKM